MTTIEHADPAVVLAVAVASLLRPTGDVTVSEIAYAGGGAVVAGAGVVGVGVGGLGVAGVAGAPDAAVGALVV